MSITVLNPGLLTTVQDQGRVGYQQFGVSVSGVMDPRSAALANILAGNDQGEAVLECTILAIKLCMPILAAELLGQVGMGILMKVIPQINVFAINIDLKVIIGLGLLYLLLNPISEFLLGVEVGMLQSLQRLLPMMSGG